MRIIAAPDSFKGSLTAVDAAEAMKQGVLAAFPEAEVVLIPSADGGEGTLDTLVSLGKGTKKQVTVTGPLGESVLAEYGVLTESGVCVIEMASASGIELIAEEQLNPLKATTYGTGELIRQALDDGYTSFILAIGGSATNDGGAGMLQALGMKLLDERGESIGFGGGSLGKLHQIDCSAFDPRIAASSFVIASDVENPFIGVNGASYVFGPQKGATPEMVLELDRQLAHFADKVAEKTGIKLHDRPGAGAAGGIGGAFQAFFPSRMERGIDIVLQHQRFSEHVENADLVLTGEGRVDAQTVSGKTAMGIAQAAGEKGVPVIVLAGSVGDGAEALYDYGVVSLHSIMKRPMTMKEAIEEAADLLRWATEQAVRAYFHSKKRYERGEA